MQHDRFRAGAFVFTRARGLQPQDPAELTPLVAQYGIDSIYLPQYAGDRVTIGRAISQSSSGLHREGFLLRPIRRTSTEVLYGIVREQKDENAERLDHDFEATVSWSAEPNPSIVHGDHAIARRVATAYDNLRGKITSEDWSSSITSFLETHDAARVRGDGRVYWIPPQRLADIKKLGAFLAEVGIDLVLAEIEAESRTVVEAVAQDSLDEQLTHLEDEVASFDGTQRPSTYARRLDEYQRLRQRAGLYRDALGLGVQKAEKVLGELEQRVGAMLDIRLKTVVHRDGTVDKVQAGSTNTGLATSANSVPTLRFAGATFTAAPSDDPTMSLFTSDDQTAISTAQVLEGMGLAGKWQQAGTCQVNIRNSGPPGAAVSIRIKMPDNQPTKSVVAALAGLGIELLV
jgi:hypothetical protein